MNFRSFRICFAALAVLCAGIASAAACPFCDAPTQTLSEETASADAVVLAKLVKEAPPVSGAADPNSGTATFEIIEVLRGQDNLKGVKEARAVYFGEADKDRVFLISGLGAEELDWTTPLPLSKAAEDYVRKLPSVPPSGADRLAFFQEYLENDDPLLAQDAYDEFARAPYEEVQALGPRMHHADLVNWIADYEINPSRRRLYLTMLGVCGGKGDLPLLESMITSDFVTMEPALKEIVSSGMAMNGPLCLPGWIEIIQQQERQKKLGLDALVACYLTLRGPDGLDLIDQRFLKDPKVEYTHIYSTIMALRFHGDQETGVLPRERLLNSMRLLLGNPDFADQVILDLSRWEDWSVLDRLVEMFKTADEKSYVRQPVVTYLTVAAEQPGDVGKRASAAMTELEQLDPETVKQARSLMAFGALARAKANDKPAAASDAEKSTESPGDTEAFAASAADNETDASDIPDPAAYEEGQQKGHTSDNVRETADVSAAETAKDAKTEVKATKPVAQSVPIAAAEAASQPQPMLIVGVPLLAAGLLMGVYWLILRVGAV
ncbi:MAG: hypothetical protein L0228_02305 [Planctomycetes bacterium]|nr:hypothetical protein [Planctomycetota bacterium]